MKSLMMLVGLFFLIPILFGGCGGNPCQDACEKIKSCGIETFMDVPVTGCEEECNSEQTECVAECINNTSCSELKDIATITMTSSQSDLEKLAASKAGQCLAGCYQ